MSHGPGGVVAVKAVGVARGPGRQGGDSTMAWFTPKPLLLPDIIALNAAYLNRKTAFVDCTGVDRDRRISWAEFGTGTNRVVD